jgi:hypothetical protein
MQRLDHGPPDQQSELLLAQASNTSKTRPKEKTLFFVHRDVYWSQTLAHQENNAEQTYRHIMAFDNVAHLINSTTSERRRVTVEMQKTNQHQGKRYIFCQIKYIFSSQSFKKTNNHIRCY